LLTQEEVDQLYKSEFKGRGLGEDAGSQTEEGPKKSPAVKQLIHQTQRGWPQPEAQPACPSLLCWGTLWPGRVLAGEGDN